MVATPDPLLLWPEGAPGAFGSELRDRPCLYAYPAESGRPRPAVIVFPGGGYCGLAPHEGRDYALFLREHAGVHAFVLQYRLGSHGYRHPRILEDAARAVRVVRARAAEWGVDPARLGVMGSSAGGHLASTLLTHFEPAKPDAPDPLDRPSSRPDFGILCYPVISLKEGLTHMGSRTALLGDNPPAGLVDSLSNETQVTASTPPCFLFHTVADTAVPAENSLVFASALRKAGVPFDLHLYQKGVHGIGLAVPPPFLNAHPWSKDLLFWLAENGWRG